MQILSRYVVRTPSYGVSGRPVRVYSLPGFQITLLNFRFALVIKKLSKYQNLTHFLLELIARVLNMLIGLKCDNYYSKVFKRVNYKLSNNMFRVVITPPPDDTERASLSGSTPSGFPKGEAHGTCEHHTPDNSISYLDMLSGSLTKVSEPCYFIPKACHSPCSATLQWCV